jgi:hypothetical protein
MSQQYINVGASANDGLGDPIRTAFQKTNENFTELYANSGNGGNANTGNITFSNVTISTVNNSVIQFTPNTALPNLTWVIGDVTDHISILAAPTSDNTQIGAFLMPGSNGEGILGWSNLNPYYNTVVLESTGNITLATNSGNDIWVFDETGVLTFPNSATISDFANTASLNAGGNIDYAQLYWNGNIGNGNPLDGSNYYTWAYAGDGIFEIAIKPANTSSKNWQFLANGNLTVPGNIIISGSNSNITGANVITAKVVSTTGNITTDGFFIGNFVGNISGNLVVPGANTQVLYNNNGNAGASSGLTFDSASNVLASTGNISTSGNIISLSVYTSSVVSATGNIRGGNLNTAGIVFATGNVIGNYIIGNGSTLSSITGGNVTGQVGNALISGTVYTNAQPNITSVGTLTSVTSSGLISTTGNVIGNYIIGNGSKLSSITGGNVTGQVGNALISGTVYTNAQPNITSVGTLSSLSVSGNVVANSVVTPTGTFRLPSYSTSQIANIAATGGDMVYNSTLQLVQVYQLNPATNAMGWVSWTVAVYQ